MKKCALIRKVHLTTQVYGTIVDINSSLHAVLICSVKLNKYILHVARASYIDSMLY